MPTSFPAITRTVSNTAFRAFKKKSPAARQAFYSEYTAKHVTAFPRLTWLKGEQMIIDEVLLCRSKSKAAKRNFEYRSTDTLWGYYSEMPKAATETKKSQALRLFFLGTDFKHYLEFLENLSSRLSPRLLTKRHGFPSCCGARSYEVISRKASDGSKPTDKMLEELLKSKEIFPRGSSSAWFFYVPVDLTPNYRKILEADGWNYVTLVEGITVFFKFCLLETHDARIEKNKERPYRPVLKDIKKSVWGSKNRRYKKAAETGVSIAGAYTGFGNNEQFVTAKCFRDTKHPLEFLILRDYTGFCQMGPNQKAVEAHGFKLLYEGFEADQNSSHSSRSHWLLPMYRINPHYEEDR